MKKLIILKDGQEIRSGNFSDLELLNIYLEKLSKNGIVGLRPERPELVLDEATGEMIPTGNILPAEYEIVIEDITAQVEQERINAEALAFLASTDWLIIRELDAGIACPADIKAQRQQARNSIVK